MSRVPPFPTRRRSPSLTNGSPADAQPESIISAPGASVRPLQISRQPSRPNTPGSKSPTTMQSLPQTAPVGPRPKRSELRVRASDYGSSDRGSTYTHDPYRDSISTTRSDLSVGSRAQAIGYNQPSSSRPKPQRLQTTSDDDPSSPATLASVMSAFKSAGSRRRQTPTDSDETYVKEREDEFEAEKARQKRIRDKAPGLRTRGISKAGDIDAVLDQVKDGWEFVIDPDFNHVDLALQLLDKSSLGKDMSSFRRTKNLLSQALKGSVDKHYQAFAASLPHHASLFSHLGAAQEQLSDARSSLLESKNALGSKRADLVQLWARGQTLEEMIRILDQIEHLKLVPDLLESLMSEKRLLQASVLLVRSLKMINKPDMLEIGAVSDLRSYLVIQENALREILIDELQSHLYLKSFWCETRWSAYVHNQQTFPKTEFENEPIANVNLLNHASPKSSSFPQARLKRFITDLALRPNDPPLDMNELGYNNTDHLTSSNLAMSVVNSMIPSSALQTNPEVDSFAYMETLLESLAVLGKLGASLDNIAQRLSGEIFSLVEATLDEVEERAEYGRRQSMTSLNKDTSKSQGIYILSHFDQSPLSMSMAKNGSTRASTLRHSALESTSKMLEHDVLKDLFWTLYSKLDAVAQGLRVVYEVANRIGTRRDFKDSSGAKPGALFPLSEVWSPIQVEVRMLIHDYLTDEQQGATSGRNPISSINEILRDGKFARDRVKPVFRFVDTDMKLASKALKPHEDGLARVLKDTMPGLVPGPSGDASQATSASIGDDRLLGSDQHHRLLIQPDAFHVTVLFQPTLTFLERVTDVLPFGIESTQASSAILDDFVLKVYLPQLEEKVSELFHQAVSGPDAFEPDPLSLKLCPEPLIKASTNLMALINSLCAMLRTNPFHRENYSRLILGVVIQFYQRCSDRFQSLTTLPVGSRVSLATQWAQKSEIRSCLSELFLRLEMESSKQLELCVQETNIELGCLGSEKLCKEDLVPTIRNLTALASLYRGVSWFSFELDTLKARPDDVISPTNLSNLDSAGLTPFTPNLTLLPVELSEPLQLSLSKEMALRFQALLKTYEQLSSLILDTMRIDLRCRVIFYLHSSFIHGNHSPAFEAAEPDPDVVSLNRDLVHFDEFALSSLPKRERYYLFAGLGDFMEHMLISNARNLQVPNAFGVKKVMRNILAIQQSMKTLASPQNINEFERAKKYYSLFFISPQEMLDGIKLKRSYSFDEYQTMLNLQCGINPFLGESGAAKATDRNYSMYVIELHGLEMDRSES